MNASYILTEIHTATDESQERFYRKLVFVRRGRSRSRSRAAKNWASEIMASIDARCVGTCDTPQTSTACLKVGREGQVKSTENHGCEDTRYQSYFQVMKVIVHSYKVWAWFSTLNKTVGDLGLRHNSKIWGEASDWLRVRSSQLGGRKTSFASIQTVEGSNSYSVLKC